MHPPHTKPVPVQGLGPARTEEAVPAQVVHLATLRVAVAAAVRAAAMTAATAAASLAAAPRAGELHILVLLTLSIPVRLRTKAPSRLSQHFPYCSIDSMCNGLGIHRGGSPLSFSIPAYVVFLVLLLFRIPLCYVQPLRGDQPPPQALVLRQPWKRFMALNSRSCA